MATDARLIRQITHFDNPYLRHFVKKHGLNEKETLMLGVLLKLTDGMKVAVKTSYSVLARSARVDPGEAYRLLNNLHRHRIIETLSEGEYIRVAFYPLVEPVDEINLAFRNARRIDRLEKDMRSMKGKDFLPREELFDTIYPLVGALITKKIGDALRSLAYYIDERLEAATSARLWRYRVQSRISGVPVGEIVLRNSLPFIVEEIFIIEKKSGILLAHHSRKDDGGADRDLVSGMLTAIKDFVKTSFRAGGDDEVNEISYGDARIMIREEPYFYAAVVVTGVPDMSFCDEVDGFALELHKNHRNLIRNYRGDMERLAPLQKPVRTFIERFSTLPKKEASGRPALKKLKVLGGVVTAVVLYFVAAAVYFSVVDTRLERSLRLHLADKLPPFSHDTSLAVNRRAVTLSGLAASELAARRLEELVSAFPGVAKVENRVLVADMERINRFIGEVREIREGMENVMLGQLRAELEKIVIAFPLNVAEMGKEQRFQVKRIYEIIHRHPSVEVDIVAFSDNIGSYELNRELALRRMEAVRRELTGRGIAPGRVHVIPFAPEIVESDPRLAAYKNERGIMIFARLGPSREGEKNRR